MAGNIRRVNPCAMRPAGIAAPFLALALALCAGGASAALDLRNATVEHLPNGLTLIMLEDRNFPVASVQMLYRVGARNEITGQIGLAHFFEHMAFRESKHFPDTGLVSAIYARGGEWHGYTWIDQTTYYATVPAKDLDLLLRIEADRMNRLIISADDVPAERGAVLAEMHLYENDPAALLIDAVMFTAFIAHPYRNNTIGWASDIENLQADDLVAYYQRHYHPANAILAVVGDIDPDQVRTRVRKLFGRFPARQPTASPHTVEPAQNGERRVRLHGRAERPLFAIGYHAPSVNNPDFAAFVVLQELLGASSGVNFLQNDWGTPVAEGTLLDGSADNLTTWYPPSEQDYLFVISGSAPKDVGEAAVELAIEKRLATLRTHRPDNATLDKAVEAVLNQLVYDVQTTEDAAHQLAFFEGLGALDTLLDLPGRIAAVTPAQVQRAAHTYLRPEHRSIAWYGPAHAATAEIIDAPQDTAHRQASSDPAQAVDRIPLPAPVSVNLSGGIPVIVQPSDLSPAASLTLVLPAGAVAGAPTVANHPVQGYSSLSFALRPQELTDTVRKARALTAGNHSATDATIALSNNPATRLEQSFADFMADEHDARVNPAVPALIVVSGDVGVEQTLALLNESFGLLQAQPYAAAQTKAFKPGLQTVHVDKPIAQAQLGYIVPAPPPVDAAADAFRLLRYIVSHGYEGRLGKAAISRRGLAYYIDSRYRSNGSQGWITLAVGVDAEKVEALKSLLLAELARLIDEPPTAAEIDEAKAHFLGRARSEAQSNEELTTSLAIQWLWYGSLQTADDLEQRLARVSRQDILDVVPAFTKGAIIVVTDQQVPER